MDFDEVLIIPPGWTTALAFDSHRAISFGGHIPCGKEHSFDAARCDRVSKGARKYALRADLETANSTQELEWAAPQFIHGHPLELLLPKDSGVFFAHFHSCHPPHNISDASQFHELAFQAKLSGFEDPKPSYEPCPPALDKKGHIRPWLYAA